MPTVGKRVKELRESLGLSVDEFARALKVHRSSIYRYEESNPKEIRDMPISIAINISEKYNVSLDWLVGSSDVKYKDLAPSKINDMYNNLSQDGQKETLNYIQYIKGKENNNG